MRRTLLALAALSSFAVWAPPMAAQVASPFVPDTVFATHGGARVVLLGGETDGIAALRLSLPLDEHPAEAGAGVVLARLALERMGGPARQVGARVSAHRTPTGLAFTVEGSEADLEYLTYLLRLAVAEPVPEAHILGDIRADLISELLGEAEAPLPRILTTLRSDAAPSEPRIRGTAETLAEVSGARLYEVWNRSHRSGQMSIVAATRFEPAVLLANLDPLGATGDTVPPLGDAPAPSSRLPTPPPALRSWYAEAWSDHRPLDPHTVVLSHLVAERIAAGPAESEMSARLERLSDRSLLVIAGVSFQRQSAEVRRRVSDMLTSLRDTMTDEMVATARAEIELQYRTAAASPGGLVNAIGTALDATGSHLGAAEYLQELGTVTAESLAAHIDALSGPFQAGIGR